MQKPIAENHTIKILTSATTSGGEDFIVLNISSMMYTVAPAKRHNDI